MCTRQYRASVGEHVELVGAAAAFRFAQLVEPVQTRCVRVVLVQGRELHRRVLGVVRRRVRGQGRGRRGRGWGRRRRGRRVDGGRGGGGEQRPGRAWTWVLLPVLVVVVPRRVVARHPARPGETPAPSPAAIAAPPTVIQYREQPAMNIHLLMLGNKKYQVISLLCHHKSTSMERIACYSAMGVSWLSLASFNQYLCRSWNDWNKHTRTHTHTVFGKTRNQQRELALQNLSYAFRMRRLFVFRASSLLCHSAGPAQLAYKVLKKRLSTGSPHGHPCGNL